MAVFDMIAAPPEELWPQADAISMRYFTVDTADMDDVDEWVRFNPHILTYAMHEGEVAGFFNVMPLTMECGELFMRNEILEEDLRTEHMLMHEALPFAQYGYVAAIAVKDTHRYLYKQCAAALLATMADMLLHGYSKEYFRMLFINPTTFEGNKLTTRMGIRPLRTKKGLLSGNDIYAVEMNDETRAGLQALSDRYARFVGKNPWKPTQK